MAVDSEVQAFLFRAVSANSAIEALHEDGTLLEQRSGQRRGAPRIIDDFTYPIRVEAARMGGVYELLFCFENSVRELVETRLQEAFGVDRWWIDGVPNSVRTKAEKLENRERKTPWHGPRGRTRLAYVDFPELGQIITERWEHFEDLLGNPEWVANFFDETNLGRRAIAHTGVLGRRDADRLASRVQDWLSAVG